MKSNRIRQPRRLPQTKLRTEPFDVYRNVLTKLCQTTVYSWGPAGLGYIRNRDWRGLVEYADSLSSQLYDDAAQHYAANQFVALVKKYPSFPGFDPEMTAFRKFAKAEWRCHRVNARFRMFTSLRSPHEYSLQKARSFIRYVIGERPNLNQIYDNCDFGPGASIGVSGNATHPGRKIPGEWSVTPAAAKYLVGAFLKNSQLMWSLFPQHAGFSSGSHSYDVMMITSKFDYVSHNKIMFVPKTAKTHRSIAVEPLGNGFLQKGVDTVMRLYLKRIGIDLTDQGPNQQMAKQGSIDGDFCTIDLSSASDSISIGLVKYLLPPEWFSFLNEIRSSSYLYKGEVKPYHKFCSMGNGFCFPLETLIFAAICHAVGAGKPGVDFRVYGDDIIVRKDKFQPVVELLDVAGFATNKDKTFSEGPFRESCGADYFLGLDVRPYYLDEELTDVRSLYKIVNSVRSKDLWSTFFEPVIEYLISLIPEEFLFWRPGRGEPDTGLDSYGDEHLTSPHVRYLRGNGSWRCKELASVPVGDKLTWDDFVRSIPYAASKGARSEQPFVKRRTTRPKIRLTTYCGATSRWLPPQY